LGKQFQRVFRTFRDGHQVFRGLKTGRKHTADISVVVDDENVSQVCPRLDLHCSF
jgi:DNA-binding transcriptional regulator of glucitol operon